MDKNLRKTLFRSLLRWNRQPAVVKSVFTIDPVVYGIDKLLPTGVTKLQSREGVHGAIIHCFRNVPFTDDKVDLAFTVLKRLGSFSVELKERYLMKLSHNEPPNSCFSPGDVVCHTESGCRCVIIGLLQDPGREDMVMVLFDQTDVEDLTAAGFRFSSEQTFFNSDFKALDHPSLADIYHECIPAYFQSFDADKGRFIPHDGDDYGPTVPPTVVEPSGTNPSTSSKDSRAATSTSPNRTNISKSDPDHSPPKLSTNNAASSAVTFPAFGPQQSSQEAMHTDEELLHQRLFDDKPGSVGFVFRKIIDSLNRELMKAGVALDQVSGYQRRA